MRFSFAVILLAGILSACADKPVSTVVVKPFTGHVPRIPGNYQGTAASDSPYAPPAPTAANEYIPLRPSYYYSGMPQATYPSSWNGRGPTDFGQEADASYCRQINPPRYQKACERKADEINRNSGN
jgi:hypothetical protein